MGIGDDVIATGMAKGAAARGKRIAFGDGVRIRWGPHSSMVFKNNPNVAPPGAERSPDLEWVTYYKGKRIYNTQSVGRWNWNYGFRVRPGEFFLDGSEESDIIGDHLVLIEPHTPDKPCAPNKQWPIERFRKVADVLTQKGFKVRQFAYGKPHVVGGQPVSTPTFRHAVGLLKRARLAILPEGGLHHAAAAVGTPAVVLFGGFTPPAVLGYEEHVNLTGGATACGSFTRCQHCVDAMAAISVDQVVAEAEKFLCR